MACGARRVAAGLTLRPQGPRRCRGTLSYSRRLMADAAAARTSHALGLGALLLFLLGWGWGRGEGVFALD